MNKMPTMKPLINFLPYQRKWLLDKNRFKIGMFARQTGKTLINAAEILQDCLNAELAGQKTRWIILSRGERQAREMIENYLKPFAKAYCALLPISADLAKQKLIFSANEICLPGGSRITALPANADAARGFSANLYLDEFAFHRNSQKVWQALYPIISAPQFKIRITSTPAGKNNKFYQLMTQNENQNNTLKQADIWSRHIVNIHQAIAQGLPRNIDMLRRGAGDDYLWQQEFELNWLDDKQAWLNYGLIISCEDDHCAEKFSTKNLLNESNKGEFFMGVDISLKHDLYAIVVLEKYCRYALVSAY